MDSWDCRATEKLIEDYLAGEADPATWEAAEDHAAGCADCGPSVEKAKRYLSLVEGAMKAMGAAVTRGALDAETAKMLAAPPSRRTSARVAIRRRRYAYFAMAAAAALIMIALYLALGALRKIQKASPSDLARLQVNTMSKTIARLRNPNMPRFNDRRFVALLEGELAKQLDPDQRPRIKNGRFLDPWERPFIVREKETGGNLIVYSIGENGLDESCAGDDISPTN